MVNFARNHSVALILAGLAIVAGVVTSAPSPAHAQAEVVGRASAIASYQSLLQAAAAQIRAGNYDAGGAYARQAFAIAQTNRQKVDAARLVASAHFHAGRYTRAEVWLRKAFNAAPDAQNQAVLRQEFAQVRQKNPLRLRFGTSVAPNDNVNNGSSSDTITIWNLPFVLSADARALSGTEASANIDLSYRLSESQDQATHLGLVLYGRTYELSRAAKAAAPGVTGSDYAFAMAEASLSHDRRFKNFPGVTSFKAVAGQFWYGGAPYIRYGRAEAAQAFELSANTSATLSLGYENQKALSTGGTRSDIASAGAGINHRRGNSDTIAVNLLLSRTRSQDPTARNTATKAQVSYGFGKLLLGTQLALTLSGEKRDYGFSIYDPAGRHDLTWTAGANMVFVNATFFGFSPSLSLEMSQTNSNVSLYDRQSTAVRLGIQSTF